MAEAVIIAVSILVLAAVLAFRGRHRDELRRLIGRKVVVQLEEATIVGTLSGAGVDYLDLSDASAGVTSPQKVDGTLHIARSRVQYVQAVGN